ncbi:UbiX family flavin prenyltransferase [Paraherbaspirillum soli]|uniref:Flavin prenyltransferase UbiX n=1 Tax=Paraherbaspirillum soli TaxID=631222 RepID=A0ABW0MFT5_9BURK
MVAPSRHPDAPQLPRRLIIGITGATGAIYGVRLLQLLREMPGIETHLLISDAGVLNLHQELDMRRKQVETLAHVVHNVRDVGAAIASGSFQSDGMIIAPCSMKTLASVANGLSDNLIARAADVVLKERRRLVLMVRETPFNLAHLRNMTSVTEMGGIIFPPLPGFYHRPQNISEMIDHTLGRVLDLFAFQHALTPRWAGLKADQS